MRRVRAVRTVPVQREVGDLGQLGRGLRQGEKCVFGEQVVILDVADHVIVGPGLGGAEQQSRPVAGPQALRLVSELDHPAEPFHDRQPVGRHRTVVEEDDVSLRQPRGGAHERGQRQNLAVVVRSELVVLPAVGAVDQWLRHRGVPSRVAGVAVNGHSSSTGASSPWFWLPSELACAARSVIHDRQDTGPRRRPAPTRHLRPRRGQVQASRASSSTGPLARLIRNVARAWPRP